MTKTFPSDEKTRLIISDDIRQEIGGKLSILGIYPGSSMTITTISGVQPVLSSLCLMWSFIDGEGEFSLQISIIDPNGQKIIDTPLEKMSKQLDGDMNVVVKMAPFTLNAFGIFKCRIILDEQLYEREITFVDASAI